MALEIDWTTVEEVSPPGEPSGGNPEGSNGGHYCQTCGVEVTRPSGRGPWPRQCPDHKATSSTGKGKTGGSGGHKGGATEADWRLFGATALIAITYCLGRWLAGGQGLFLKNPGPMSDQQFEETTDYLAMNADEAKPLAQIMAMRITPTAFNKKYGKHIVAALEYEEAGAALLQYGQRILPAAQARFSAPKAPRTPRKRVAPVTKPPQTQVKEANGHVPTEPLSNIEAARLYRRDISTDN